MRALLLLWTVLSGAGAAARVSRASPQGFLEKYGYLSGVKASHSAAEVRSALREFQWTSHLPVSGQLDTHTLHKMASPRCGVQDGGSGRAWGQRVTRVFTGHTRRKRHTLPNGEKWNKRVLSYRLENVPRRLSRAQVRRAVMAAFQLWSNVSGLVFLEVPQGPADIRLAFFQGEHNDGTGNAFDGPGGALAHAFFPFRGEAHFDLSERWTLSGLKGHNLFLVTAHEIGHTLGLGHSPVRHALMSAYYKKFGAGAVLSWDDVAAVQQLYGKPRVPWVRPLAGGALSVLLMTGAGQDYCEGFDAITTEGNGTLLVFRGHMFWSVTEGVVGGPFPLHTRWPQLPLGVEAAAYSPPDGKLYFFRGGRVWRYSGSALDRGFPVRTGALALPRHFDSAFFYQPLGHMVLLKGSRYFVLNAGSLALVPYYPRPLSDWAGAPPATNGVVTHTDGRLYFFKEQRYWRFDPGKVRVAVRGRWAESLGWMGCQSDVRKEAARGE